MVSIKFRCDSCGENADKLTDWMSAWVADEDFFKVRAANCENDFVTLQQLSIASDCTIDKISAIE